MFAKWMMMACATACAGCVASTNQPLFKDVQRTPPAVDEPVADYLVREARPLAEWIAETRIACNRFGCS